MYSATYTEIIRLPELKFTGTLAMQLLCVSIGRRSTMDLTHTVLDFLQGNAHNINEHGIIVYSVVYPRGFHNSILFYFILLIKLIKFIFHQTFVLIGFPFFYSFY